jgi:signal transduction histidine kinase
MHLINVVRRFPLTLPLACVAAITMVLISESAYWQLVGTLDALKDVAEGRVGIKALQASVTGSSVDIHHTLLLSRIGVALLSLVSLGALYLYLSQRLLIEGRRDVRDDKRERIGLAERDRLEDEVSRRTAQLVQLTHHLETAREDERTRLARDLHDELGALLTSAKLDAARIKMRLGKTAPEALERLAHLVDTLNAGIALKRDIVENLRPSALDTLGLVTTLEIFAREFGERSGMKVRHTLAPVKLGAAAELVVYRMVQEATTNIAKYAKATQIWIDLSSRDGEVHASVRDDGIGFDTSAPLTSAYGLVGMRFRIEAERGSMAITSSPGQGTLIAVRFPEEALVPARAAENLAPAASSEADSDSDDKAEVATA